MNIGIRFLGYFSLSVFVTACSNSGGSDEPESNLLLNDDFVSFASELTTGDNTTDLESSWFCTFTDEDVYIDRKQLHFIGNGDALIDGIDGAWGFSEEALHIETGDRVLSYKDLEFGSRIFPSDFFNASNGNLGLSCDWTGPAREGVIFNDSFDGQITSDDLTGDGIDTLLVTGRTPRDIDSHWDCAADDQSRAWIVRAYADGAMFSGEPARWKVADSDVIKLSFTTTTETWSNVIVPLDSEVQYGRFTALSSNGYGFECLWSGEPRAQEYQP